MATRQVAREVALVGGVSFDGCAGALVGGAVEDEAHEFAQVEISCGKMVCDGGEERFVGSRVGSSEIVDGVDDADTEKAGPDAVGDGAREVGVVGRSEPVGEGFAPVLRIVHRQGGCVERGGWLGFAGARLDEVAVWIDEERAFSVTAPCVAAPAFGADSGEQVCEGVVLVVSPFFERVVVALCAVDGESEERLTHVFGHGFRVLVDGVEVGCALGKAVAFGDEHFAHDLVPRGVLGDLGTKPGVVGFDRVWPEIGAVNEEDVGEPVGPVIDELWATEEGFDEARTFLGGAVG